MIKKPGKRPFAPWLQNSRALKKGKGRKSGVQELLMTPLIDMFVILVVFLIMNFSATGDFQLSGDIKLPQAQQTDDIKDRAPIVQISANTVAVEGVKVGDSEELLKDQDLRIPALTEKLTEMRKVDEMMHGTDKFRGELIINCDKEIDFKLVRKVMFAAADAGYAKFNYAVMKAKQGS